MSLFHWPAELLFPPKCVLCGTLLSKGEQGLCRRCRADAPFYPNGKRKLQFLDSFAAVWYYEGYVRRSLLRYKFYGARWYAASYGRLLAMTLLERYPEGFDCLTWVPVSFPRKLRRGYDQVELLARAVGRELGMTPVPLLRKIGRSGAPGKRVGCLPGDRPGANCRKADFAVGRYPDHRRDGGGSGQGAADRRGEGSTLRRCRGGTKVK